MKIDRCPDCEAKLKPAHNLEYLGITYCGECRVYWNKEKTKKTTKWKRGIPYFGDEEFRP